MLVIHSSHETTDNRASTFAEMRDAIASHMYKSDDDLSQTEVDVVIWKEEDRQDEIMLVLPNGDTYTIRNA